MEDFMFGDKVSIDDFNALREQVATLQAALSRLDSKNSRLFESLERQTNSGLPQTVQLTNASISSEELKALISQEVAARIDISNILDEDPLGEIVDNLDFDILTETIAEKIKEQVLQKLDFTELAKALAEVLYEEDEIDIDFISDRVSELLVNRLEITLKNSEE